MSNTTVKWDQEIMVLGEAATMPSVEKKGNELVIRLRDYGLPFIEEYQNGIKLGEGMYTHEALAHAILRSSTTDGFATPMLPRGTIRYTEAKGGWVNYCFIEVQPHRRTVYYHEAAIDDVPFPRLIFGFELMQREGKHDITKVMLGALEDQCLPNEDSEVYFYPYTNVTSDFTVCWGGSQLPCLDRVSQLTTIPELFFNSPNSDCYYSSANMSKLPYRELVEKLKGKEFPDDYLKKTGRKLSEWIEEMAPSF
ncbi:hypothetical protein P4K96_04205 [Bacillus cereus]|nr:hypothetical protein [Bacillus cereus]